MAIDVTLKFNYRGPRCLQGDYYKCTLVVLPCNANSFFLFHITSVQLKCRLLICRFFFLCLNLLVGLAPMVSFLLFYLVLLKLNIYLSCVTVGTDPGRDGEGGGL